MPLRSNLRAIREQAGLSQGELAARVGISRQALSKLEAGTGGPNLVTALSLARVLACSVEQLFTLDDDNHGVVVCEGDLVAGQRVVLTRVSGRWVAHPLDVLQSGFQIADGVVRSPAGPDRWHVELSRERELIEDQLLIAGCAPSLAVLVQLAAEHGLALRWLPADSGASLDLLVRGRVHLAGLHLRDPETGDYNHHALRRALSGRKAATIRYARWSAGLALAPGNPQRVTTPRDVVGGTLRLAKRQAGAGATELLRRCVPKRARLDRLPGPHAGGHLDVARLVAAGLADVGVTTEAVARGAGLDFLPMSDETFDLGLVAELVDDARVGALVDVLARADVRGQLAPFGSEDPSEAGRLEFT